MVPSFQSKTVLLVEDQALIAMVQTRELEKFGYSVVQVSTGEEAVRKMEESSEDIDLILMDIDLGTGMDGTKAAELILGQRDVPIVFLSSHTEPEVVQKTEKITSYGYVVKNSGIVVLDASIKMAWKLYQAKKEKELANQALKESEALFKTILNEVPSVSVQGFTMDGTVVYWNKASENFYGYKAEEAIGKNLCDLIIPPKARMAVKQSIQKMAETGIATPSEELVLMRKDGNPISVFSSHVLITIPGKEMELFCVDIDLTKHREAEDEIKKQLLTKEILIREIHHRVLNNIANIEEFLLDQAYISGNPETNKILHDIIFRVRTIRVLYKKILSPRDSHETSLQSYINDVIQSIANTFRSHNLEVEKSIQDIRISQDKAVYFGIIINELLTNVYKYAYNKNEKGKAFVSLENNGGNIQLTVQDYGTGINPEKMKLKSRSFGIPMVQMLVEILGGSFQMTKENGTKTKIELNI